MSTPAIARARKPPSYEGDQQISRLPHDNGTPYRPGQWVKVRDFSDASPDSGAVRRVKSLTCSITTPEQRRAIWRVHLEPDGRSVAASCVERHATIAERQKAERNGGGTR